VDRAGVTDPVAFDRDVRVMIAECIRERGAVPSLVEVADRVAASASDVAASFGRLAAARAMILRPGTTEILSFNPFAAGPTDFRVRSGGREWSALCAWDAFGVVAALKDDGLVLGHCADVCGVPLEVRLAGDAIGALDGVVMQFALPAREWWKDIVFT
jgi:alkylmercury lyase-like protein